MASEGAVPDLGRRASSRPGRVPSAILVASFALAALAGCAHPRARPAAPPASDSAPAPGDTSWQTDLDRKVLESLTATRESGPIVFHYREGDLTAEQLEEDVAANVAYFHELQHELAMEYAGRIHVFLYRDKADMRATTGGDADIAFSTGTVSVHQLHDFRGVHELTHIFALQFPGNADGAGPDLFLTEGLATALAESDQGVPIDAWAAMYLRLGKLPELSALRADFMGAAPKGVHPYHVAASFVQSLIDRFGIEAVKLYYENSTEAGMLFGVPLPRLERDWRQRLAGMTVAPEHEAHVLARFAKDLERPPPEWRTKSGVTLIAGDTAGAGLANVVPDDPSRWTPGDGALVGRHDGPWTGLRSRAEFGPDVGLRVRFRLVEGDAVKLFAGDREAIFASWSSYLGVRDGHVGDEEVCVPAGVWCEALFVKTGSRGRVALNGLPLFDRDLEAPPAGGPVGLAVERGVLEVAELTVFQP